MEIETPRALSSDELRLILDAMRSSQLVLNWGEQMGRLWQVGLGLALATACLTIAGTQTVTRDKNGPDALIHYVVTEPNGLGIILTYVWMVSSSSGSGQPYEVLQR